MLAGALPVAASRAETEPVVLEINGRVPASRRFTLADLSALGTTHIRTSTLWTDGIRDFEGVLARKVIEAAGVPLTGKVVARGLNDYTATIPLSDFLDYDVILAWSMDGV
ncbi:MAG: molybdopterin-dependent oxidoreductase, partial [Devosia nanyangense]|nr:molybdopterin-dependent oxidoreductase [Devosia nanyangense]